ncbi:hypothetical protein D7X99_23495 [Corallococcus sp. AB032C]|nr:hypothetical protein D7X99_23495 [Corallococcus sp. AB032C]
MSDGSASDDALNARHCTEASTTAASTHKSGATPNPSDRNACVTVSAVNMGRNAGCAAHFTTGTSASGSFRPAATHSRAPSMPAPTSINTDHGSPSPPPMKGSTGATTAAATSPEPSSGSEPPGSRSRSLGSSSTSCTARPAESAARWAWSATSSITGDLGAFTSPPQWGHVRDDWPSGSG